MYPKWTQTDLAQALADRSIPISPSMITRIESGERDTSTYIWGQIWEALGLPRWELYKGLELPVDEPDGIAGQVANLVAGLPEHAQRLVLAQARHAASIARELELAQGVPITTKSHEKEGQTPVDGGDTPNDNDPNRQQRGERLERDNG